MIYCHMFQQYTFILTASKELPKQCVGYGTATVKFASRKNVGVRISDDAVCQAILQEMDAPLISTRFFSSLSHRYRHMCSWWTHQGRCLYIVVTYGVCGKCDSVKGPKENEWMIDPIAIGDIYGPEVFFYSFHSVSLTKETVWFFYSLFRVLFTGSGFCGRWRCTSG